MPADCIEESQDSKYFIVTKMVNNRQYRLKVLYEILVKAWKPSGWILVSEMEPGMYMVKFELRCDMCLTLEGSPWSVNDDLLLMEVGDHSKLSKDYLFKFDDFNVQIHILGKTIWFTISHP
ncbi:hypothetical protein C5167_016481 [Papaver somniferum]|nr:hypothetical protein C5167_016481 [Papaver somniferum]